MSVHNKRYDIPGNAGLKDQSKALSWISENISRFGGDPKNILLFGQSAGGNAITRHMISNYSKELFHKAVIMSGSDLTTRFELAVHTCTDFYTLRHATLIGWDGTGGLSGAIKSLTQADPSTIIRTQANLLTPEDQLKGIRFPYGPTLERPHNGHSFLSIEPRILHLNSWSKSIPVILGSTSDEALVYYKTASALGSDLLRSINFEYKIPRDSGHELSADGKKRLAQKIRNAYFSDEQPPKDVQLRDFVRMETHRQYVHGMYRTALARLHENATNPTYYYRFHWDSQNLNHHRKSEYCGTNCKGVSHAEDLSFLFRSQYVRSKSDIGTNEFRVIQRMVNIFYQFAKDNNPNIDDGDRWEPLNKDDVSNGVFYCLNIGSELRFVELPEIEMMHFWSSMYANETFLV